MQNYFNFKKYKDKYLITNDFGQYVFVTKEDLKKIILGNGKECNEKVKREMEDKLFLIEDSWQKYLDTKAKALMLSKNYLFNATNLHIFVLTNACNLECLYCQAQKGERQQHGLMSEQIAEKAVDIALQSPNKYLTFEFQGGEPLLNYKVLQHIVEYAKAKNTDKIIEYNLVSNLTLLDEDMVEFITSNHICVSTSMDGNEAVHNNNRKYKNGVGSYKDVIDKVKMLRSNGVNVGAIQTTTNYSLKYYKEIVDSYINNGFDMIFIRPLTPLGCAYEKWNQIGYSAEEYIDFYRKSIRYIIEKNREGQHLIEGHARIFLKKILGGVAENYMELRSPCGAGVGQIAYYCDGNIYTCDEGRMAAEMGNSAFLLGDVFDNNYDDLLNSKTCKSMCSASFLEGLPGCADCVYQPYCGVCPVVNLELENDIIAKEPHNRRCKVYAGMLECIFDILYDNDEKNIDILKKWI